MSKSVDNGTPGPSAVGATDLLGAAGRRLHRLVRRRRGGAAGGFSAPGGVVTKQDRPEIRGMIATVRHLVTVEEVD